METTMIFGSHYILKLLWHATFCFLYVVYYFGWKCKDCLVFTFTYKRSLYVYLECCHSYVLYERKSDKRCR